MTPEFIDTPRVQAADAVHGISGPTDFDSRPRRAWPWIVTVLVVAGLAYAAYHYHWWPQGQPKGPAGRSAEARIVPVVAVPARKGDMPIYLNGLGSVTALNSVVIRSRVDGQLDKVAFVEGQMVTQGQLLAQIDPRPFEAQVKQAEGQLAKDEAALKNARAELEKQKLAADALPKQQIETQEALVGQYEGAIKIDQGQKDNAELNLKYSSITAPIAGKIGLRLVDQGNMIHATDANGLALITQVQPISVVFNLPQDDIPQVIKKWSPDEPLECDVFDRDLKNRLARGTLLAFDNQVDSASGTFRLKAVFPNKDSILFPNQFINARLLVETRRGVVIAPTAAVQRGPESTYAYVVKSDNTVELRTIVVGPSEGDESIIESGLSPGDVVVTDGVDKLQSGTKVGVRATGGKGKGKGGTTRPAGTTRPSKDAGDKGQERGEKGQEPQRGNRHGGPEAGSSSPSNHPAEGKGSEPDGSNRSPASETRPLSPAAQPETQTVNPRS